MEWCNNNKNCKDFALFHIISYFKIKQCRNNIEAENNIILYLKEGSKIFQNHTDQQNVNSFQLYHFVKTVILLKYILYVTVEHLPFSVAYVDLIDLK